jgi:hypothetical protein
MDKRFALTRIKLKAFTHQMREIFPRIFGYLAFMILKNGLDAPQNLRILPK